MMFFFVKLDLVVLCLEGLYCLVGDFYIDLWCLVLCVVIMYGYGDYVCSGMGYYYCSIDNVLILCWWFGEVLLDVYVYGVCFCLGDVDVLLYLVGYVLGLV